MTEKYEICPICGSMTSDLSDHLGKEKTMAVNVPLAGVPGMTEPKTVPLHYFCPDPTRSLKVPSSWLLSCFILQSLLVGSQESCPARLSIVREKKDRSP